MQDLGFRFQCRKCGPKCMYPEKKSGFIKIRNVNLSTQTVDEPKKKLAISILKKWNCTSLNMKMPQRINVYRLKPFKILKSGHVECFLYGFTYLKRSRTQIGFRNAHIDIFVCDAFSGSMRQFFNSLPMC